MRTFQILENAIMYHLSLLHFRQNILNSFNLASYDFKFSHHCSYFPLNSIQFLSLSFKMWYLLDIHYLMWSDKYQSQWTTPTSELSCISIRQLQTKSSICYIY